MQEDDILDVGEVQKLQLQTIEEQASALNLRRVELEQEFSVARMYPRSPQDSTNTISKNALYNKALASECIYALPRAGKPIKGPSVRFAEIVRNAWGNCRVHARPVGINRQDRMVVAEAAFRDLESNTTNVATVERRISDSRGNLYSDDMIIVTMNAACAIAKRNVILESVPRQYWKPAYDQVELAVKGDVETFVEYRETALKAFADFGVRPEQIYPAIGIKGPEDLTVDHIPLLRGMFTALKDGSSTVEEMFDPRRHVKLADPGSPDLAAKLRGKAARREQGFHPDHVANGLAGAAGAEIDAAQTTEEEQDQAVADAEAQAAEQKASRRKPARKAASGKAKEAKPSKPAPRKPPKAKASQRAPKGQGEASSEPQTLSAVLAARKTAEEPAATLKSKPNQVAPTPPREPKTPAEYARHVDAWLATMRSKHEIIQKWKGEMKLRNTIGMTSEERDPIWKIVSNAAEQLGEVSK